MLDAELMKRLHVYRGRDHSNEITIRHLLMQTSGLYDVFYPLWEKMMADPLGMTHAWLHGYSTPAEQPEYPTAGLFVKDTDFSSVSGAPAIDHAGGSIVAPLREYLLFSAIPNVPYYERTID